MHACEVVNFQKRQKGWHDKNKQITRKECFYKSNSLLFTKITGVEVMSVQKKSPCCAYIFLNGRYSTKALPVT